VKETHLCVSLTGTEGSSSKIGAEGVLQFCEDLGVDPTDLVVLLIAWKFGAKRMGEFSKAEFCDGMRVIGYVDLQEAAYCFLASILLRG